MASDSTPNIASTPASETAPAAPPAPGPSGMYRVFMGPKGLRAGWRIVIYVALVSGFGRDSRRSGRCDIFCNRYR